jgi:hypothetical protein
MANKAKWTILVPSLDGGLAAAKAQMALTKGAKDAHIDHAFIEPNKYAHNPGEQPQPHDFVVAYADDLPEHDSHIKQLAHSIARDGGHRAIYVLKEGKDGVTQWAIDNPDAVGVAHDALGLGNGAEGPGGVKGESADSLIAGGGQVGQSPSDGLSRGAHSIHESITNPFKDVLRTPNEGWEKTKSPNWDDQGNERLSPVPRRKMRGTGIWTFNVGNQRPEVMEHWLKTRGINGDAFHGTGIWNGTAEPTTRINLYDLNAQGAYQIFQKLCEDFPNEHSFGCIPPKSPRSFLLRNTTMADGTTLPPDGVPPVPSWYQHETPPGVPAEYN